MASYGICYVTGPEVLGEKITYIKVWVMSFWLVILKFLFQLVTKNNFHASTLNFRTKITKYISDSYFVMFQTTFIFQNFIRRQTLPLDPSQSLDHVQLLLSFQSLIMKLEQDILLTFQGSFQNGLLFSDPITWMYGFL